MNSGIVLFENTVSAGDSKTFDPFFFAGAGIAAQLVGAGGAILKASNFNDVESSWITIGSFNEANRLEASVIMLYGRLTVVGPARVKVVASEAVSATNSSSVVNVAPYISLQPTTSQVVVGSTKTFSVSAAGTPAPTYQWFRNTGSGAVSISGAISASYTTPAVTMSGGLANNGDIYTCVISNAAGSVTTSPVTLNVIADTFPRYGVGSAIAGVSSPAALLAAMSVLPGSSAGGKVSTSFTVSPAINQYGWVAVLASTGASGVVFTDELGAGGWSGASSSGNNIGASPSTSLSSVLYTDSNGTQWRFFRQDYANSAFTGTTS